MSGINDAERAALASLTAAGWEPFYGRATADFRQGIGKGQVAITGDTWTELAWKAHVADVLRGRTFLSRGEYAELFGHEPREDELQRVVCPKAGQLGHWACGVCLQHASPRFMCGCLAKAPT